MSSEIAQLIAWCGLVFVLAFLAESVAHFLPWAAWLNINHITLNYIIGTLVLTAAFAVWALATGNITALIVWVSALVGGGAGVLTMYRVDKGNNLASELNRLRIENENLKALVNELYGQTTEGDQS